MQATHFATRKLRQTGFTLVEVCMALGTSAVLLSQAVPSMTALKQEQALKSAGEAVGADLRLARSQASSQGRNMYMRFSEYAGGTCYVVYAGKAGSCDCDDSGRAACDAEGMAISTQWWAAKSGIKVRSNADQLVFASLRGTVSSTATIRVSAESVGTIHQVVSIAGRVRSCSAGAKLAGYKTCA